MLGQILAVVLLAGSGAIVTARPGAANAEASVRKANSILRVAAGGYAGYAVLSDGRVWAWGDDLEGQLGDAAQGLIRTVPVGVRSLTAVTRVAGGGNSAYGVTRAGTVFAWGDDSTGELADERFALRPVPGLVRSLPAVSYLAAGAFAAYAISRNGSAWSWGDNSFGQLGTGSGQVETTVPHVIARLKDVVEIASGSADAYALLKNGTVWAWGDNSLGQLGNGECDSTTGSRSVCLGSDIPRKVPGLTDVVAIAAGGDSGYALRRDGSVWAWGDDGFGELGNGVIRLDEDKPARVKGLGDVVAIAAGSCSGYALFNDGEVWAWGRGDFGQLGDGAMSERKLPVRVKGLTDVMQVVGGGDMAYALERDGELWAWGANAYGQLGDGSVVNSDLPVRVLGLPGALR